jgi:hypothetical protein
MAATLPALLAWRAASQGAAPALLAKRHGIWRVLTWQELSAAVEALASALVACDVTAGEAVLIAGPNRPLLLVAWLAALRVGALPVLVPQSGAGVPLAAALSETAPRIAFAAGAAEVEALRQRPPEIVVVDATEGLHRAAAPWLRGWEEFQRAAPAVPPALALPAATLVFVSDPAGGFRSQVLPQQRLIEAAHGAVGVGSADRLFAALPFGWGEPLLLGPVLSLVHGAKLGFAESDSTLLPDLREFGPTVLAGPASLFRHFRQTAWVETGSLRRRGRERLRAALGLAEDGGRASRGIATWIARRTLIDRLGLSQLRQAWVYGPPLAGSVASFWESIGVRPRPIGSAALGLAGNAWPSQEGPAAALFRRLAGSPFLRDVWLQPTEPGGFAALLSPDIATLAVWSSEQGLAARSSAALTDEPQIRALLAAEIAAAATSDARVTAWALAGPGFDVVSDERTPEGWLRPTPIERAHEAVWQRLGARSGSHAEAPASPATLVTSAA